MRGRMNACMDDLRAEQRGVRIRCRVHRIELLELIGVLVVVEDAELRLCGLADETMNAPERVHEHHRRVHAGQARFHVTNERIGLGPEAKLDAFEHLPLKWLHARIPVTEQGNVDRAGASLGLQRIFRGAGTP